MNSDIEFRETPAEIKEQGSGKVIWRGKVTHLYRHGEHVGVVKGTGLSAQAELLRLLGDDARV